MPESSIIELQQHILPWFVPKPPLNLVSWMRQEGTQIQIARGDTLLTEDRAYDSLFLIEEGAVGQAVANYELNKPMAMNVYTAQRLMGFLNIFTGIDSPRRLIALTPTTVTALPHKIARPMLESDFALYRSMAQYSERCAKSELIGMEILFTLGIEERISFFFASLLLSENLITTDGRIISESEAPGPGLVPVPYTFTRDTIRRVVYASTVSFDRLLADWSKVGWFVRDSQRTLWVSVEPLLKVIPWIMQH